MKYLLDSNILILIGKGENKMLFERLADSEEGDLVTSSVAYAEVALGSAKGMPPTMERLKAMVTEIAVLSFDYKAALAYATLPFKRGGFDRLIAAHALSHELVVVTNNLAHFSGIPGLKVENWAQ